MVPLLSRSESFTFPLALLSTEPSPERIILVPLRHQLLPPDWPPIGPILPGPLQLPPCQTGNVCRLESFALSHGADLSHTVH